MYEIKVRSSFNAAHYLTNCEGKCANLHGHTWNIEIAIRDNKVDEKGMVADFYDIKPLLTKTIECFDHTLINEVEPFNKVSPTSENLAKFIYDKFVSSTNANIAVYSVTVSESNNTSATYYGNIGDR